MGIFKGRVDVQKIVGDATSAIDKLFFTKEEKADQLEKIASLHLEYIKTTMSENSARSVTRRYLALGIMGVFLFLLVLGVIMYGFDEAYASFIFSIAKEMNTLVMMVAAFFFGAYMVGNHLLGNKNKLNKN